MSTFPYSSKASWDSHTSYTMRSLSGPKQEWWLRPAGRSAPTAASSLIALSYCPAVRDLGWK